MVLKLDTIKAYTLSVMAIVMFVMATNFYFNNKCFDFDYTAHDHAVKMSAIKRIENDFKIVTEFLPSSVISKISYNTAKELHCMALNNYYEAATEGIDGMKAVSQVVMNRIDEKGFPSTVCDVIYQKKQFSWTEQSTLPKFDAESSAWRNAVEAAQRVYLDGHTVHGLENALFYHATYVDPKWKKVVKVKKIGMHIFYKKREII